MTLAAAQSFFHFAKEERFPHKRHFSSYVFYFPLYLTSSSPTPTSTHCVQEGSSANLACFQHGLLLVVGSMWKLSNKMNQMLLLKSALLLQQPSLNTKEWKNKSWFTGTDISLAAWVITHKQENYHIKNQHAPVNRNAVSMNLKQETSNCILDVPSFQ